MSPNESADSAAAERGGFEDLWITPMCAMWGGRDGYLPVTALTDDEVGIRQLLVARTA